MKAFFILAFVCSLCNGWTYQTRCHSDSSRNCANICDVVAEGGEQCSGSNSRIERSGCDNTCEYWCRSNAKCICSCVMPSTPTICTMDDVTDLLGDVQNCAVTELQTVDHEIEEQIAYNVAQVVLGEIPILGTLFDLAFAAYDPVSPITSRYALADQLIGHINNAVEELQDCMDTKISNAKISEVMDQQEGMITQYQFIGLASGDTYTDTLTNLFDTWNLAIFEIFGTEEANLLEYLGMLPVYEALYPLYATIAIERAKYLKKSSDHDNLVYIKSLVSAVFQDFDTWILDARQMIDDSISDSLLEDCDNYSSMDDIVLLWFEHFDARYIDNFAQYSQQFNLIATTPQPTKRPTRKPTPRPTYSPNSNLIFAKTLTGDMIPIEYSETDTIENVKIIIKESDAIPVEQQLLIFEGQQLDDDKTLDDYDIQRGSILYLILRFRGG